MVLTPGAKPVEATYVVGPRPRSVAETGRRRQAAKAPLVGREAELAVMRQAVQSTVAGHSGAVLVVGEPGLGKTRLVGECRKYFMAWAGAASGRLPLWLEGRCASFASSTPYGAYQQLLGRFVGASLEEGEAVLRSALDAAMHAVLGRDGEIVPVLARMMGLPPGPGAGPPRADGPGELQSTTFSAVRLLFSRLVERGPTVLCLEDLHWSDPTSLRLTASLATLADDGPLLVLATHRPEPDPGVAELEAALAAGPARPLKVLQLEPIPKPAERSLARSLLGGEVGDEVVKLVCSGVDGNPLFLEERLASLLDIGALGRHGNTWRLEKSDATPVPAALERLVRARADRLGPASREAVVAAAVLGEDIAHSALAAVSELGPELDDALAELVSVGFLTEVRTQPELLYRFRHTVMAEAIYHGLLRSQRRQLHGRAGWALEVSATDRLEEVAAVLGRHFAAAGEDDRAVHYLEMAGAHAAQIFANQEAIALYRQALGVAGCERRPGNAAAATVGPRSVTAARISEKLADILRLVDRFDEARSAVVAALASLGPEDRLARARLLYHLSAIEYQDGDFDAARAASNAAEGLIGEPRVEDDQELVDLWLGLQLCPNAVSDKFNIYDARNQLERGADLIAKVRPLVEARASSPLVAYFYGALALLHMRERRWRVDAQIVDEWRRAADAASAPVPAHYPFGGGAERRRYLPMYNLGMALTWHGDLAEARVAYEEALASAKREGSPVATATALGGLATTAFRGADIETVRRLLPEARAAAARSRPCLADAMALEAWLAWRDGEPEEAIALAAQAVELWEPRPDFYPYCLAFWPLVGSHLDLGHIEEAVGAARRLLDPSLARLPDDLEASVTAASDAWERGRPELAGGLLAGAVQLARHLGYA